MCLCFFSSFPLDKNQYSFLLVRGSKATAGVGSPAHTDEERKRTIWNYLFSDFQRNVVLFYIHKLFGALLCPLINRLEAAEFLVQVYCVMHTYLSNASYFRTKLEILRHYLI